MRGRAILGSLAFVLLAQATAARAEECGPLKLLTALDMTPLGNGAVMTVPATFNGSPKPMLVDTGAGISNLQNGALSGLGLHAVNDSKIEMLDSAGNVSKSYVQVDEFAMGPLKLRNLQFMLSPHADAETPFAGALGGDVMSLYDTEMDFAGRKLNFFSKDHCPGHVLYWNPAAVAVVPISLQAATGDSSRTGFRSYVYRAVHVIVPVLLDGKPFQALIDTGSFRSTIPAPTAKFQFGVTAESPGSTPGGPAEGSPEHQTFNHTFATLTFDGVTVTNPHFQVVPDLFGAKDPNNSARTDSRVRHIDDNIGGHITIGMDVLRKLRLFIAFSERKLYVTPATAPAPATP